MNPDNSEFAEMLKKQFMALPRYGTTEEMIAWLGRDETGATIAATPTAAAAQYTAA